MISATNSPIAAASRIRERTSATAPPMSLSGTLNTTTRTVGGAVAGRPTPTTPSSPRGVCTIPVTVPLGGSESARTCAVKASMASVSAADSSVSGSEASVIGVEAWTSVGLVNTLTMLTWLTVSLASRFASVSAACLAWVVGLPAAGENGIASNLW